MISLVDAIKISKNFAEQEFFNSHFMSVSVSSKPEYELIVSFSKKMRTDNFPQTFEGMKVNYKISMVQERR